jgi:hypothetical protein
LVTEAEVPAAPVVVEPTETVAAAPFVPAVPCGTVKLRTAADEVPELVTVAEVPAAPVVVEPTETVAAAPLLPLLPSVPAVPCGIARERVCDGAVPVIVADALEPAAPVVTVPMLRVFAGPAGPEVPTATIRGSRAWTVMELPTLMVSATLIASLLER